MAEAAPAGDNWLERRKFGAVCQLDLLYLSLDGLIERYGRVLDRSVMWVHYIEDGKFILTSRRTIYL